MRVLSVCLIWTVVGENTSAFLPSQYIISNVMHSWLFCKPFIPASFFPLFMALLYFCRRNISLLNTNFIFKFWKSFPLMQSNMQSKASKLLRATPFHCLACVCACFPHPCCSLPSPSLNGCSPVCSSTVHKYTILQLVGCISQAQVQSKSMANTLFSPVSNKIN